MDERYDLLTILFIFTPSPLRGGAAQPEDDSRGENLLKAPVNQSRNNLQPGRNEMISHVDREIIDASK